jgi:hypothetical protein
VNIGLAKNIQCSAHLALIQLELFPEQADRISLRSGQLFKGLGSLLDQLIDLVLRNADRDGRSGNIAGNGDAALIGPDPTDLRL